LGTTYRIFPDQGVVYVHFHGVIRVEESLALYQRYIQDPGFRPGQKQLVDFSEVEELILDVPKILEMQAFKAAQLACLSAQTMMGFYAPTEVGRMMAAMSIRSWDGFDHVASSVLVTEDEVLAFLGLKETRISDLLAKA